MGWLRWLLLGDLGQQFDLQEQKAEIEQLKQRLRTQQPGLPPKKGKDAPTAPQEPADIEELRRANDELRLYVATLFRLLVRKNVVTPEELRELIEAIDSEDGTSDWRFRGDVLPPARPT